MNHPYLYRTWDSSSIHCCIQNSIMDGHKEVTGFKASFFKDSRCANVIINLGCKRQKKNRLKAVNQEIIWIRAFPQNQCGKENVPYFPCDERINSCGFCLGLSPSLHPMSEGLQIKKKEAANRKAGSRLGRNWQAAGRLLEESPRKREGTKVYCFV